MALMLRTVQGRSYDSIAAKLGVSVSALETLLFRARSNFQREYDSLREGVDSPALACYKMRSSIRALSTGTLSDLRRSRVLMHLDQCERCRLVQEDMRRRRRVAGFIPFFMVAPLGSLRDTILGPFKAALSKGPTFFAGGASSGAISTPGIVFSGAILVGTIATSVAIASQTGVLSIDFGGGDSDVPAGIVGERNSDPRTDDLGGRLQIQTTRPGVSDSTTIFPQPNDFPISPFRPNSVDVGANDDFPSPPFIIAAITRPGGGSGGGGDGDGGGIGGSGGDGGSGDGGSAGRVAAASVAAGACTGEDCETVDPCEANPDAQECQPPDTCEINPEADECQPPDPCDVNPEAEECQPPDPCEVNPEADECQPPDPCEVNPEADECQPPDPCEVNPEADECQPPDPCPVNPQAEECRPKDTDGDGVIDDEDSCPDNPGPIENGGCPEDPPPPVDSDGDGIRTRKTPVRRIPGSVENDGCPEGPPPPVDSDGDGIPDEEDSCPGDPGPAENDGCPENRPPPTDSDGDGIVDKEDACPAVPELWRTTAARGSTPTNRQRR